MPGALEAEFPGLRAEWIGCECSEHRSDAGVGERLARLASRFGGRQAVELRQQQVPAAYRSLFLQIGIDPDQQPTPIEQAALGRLVAGGNLPQDRISDALLLALLETSVPVMAFDASLVTAPIELREARGGEKIGANELAPGTLIVADAEQPLCQLFAEPEPPLAAGRASRHLLLVAVAAPGVSELASDEALTIAAEAISGG